MNDMDKDIFLIGFIVSISIYYLLRHFVNRKTELNLPILPERFHEDPLKTLAQALLTMISIGLGMFITISVAKII